MRKAASFLPDEISITWHVDDIKERDKDDKLSIDDCKQILDMMRRHHNADIGINWEVIDWHIEHYLTENKR